MKNCENELLQFQRLSRYLILVNFFDDTHILTIGIYPFAKTDSGLSVYRHGNADFANVRERCLPTRMILYKGAVAPL